MAQRVHVLYHYPCQDGVFAALSLALYGKIAEWNIVWRPIKIHLPMEQQVRDRAPPVQAGDLVYLVDLSGTRAYINQLSRNVGGSGRIVILDHHKTALEELCWDDGAPMPGDVHITLDMNRSAAMICWDYCCALAKEKWNKELVKKSRRRKELERAIALVQDVDLWRNAIPESQAFAAGLRDMEHLFDAYEIPGVFDSLANIHVDEVVQKGKIAMEEEDRTVQGEVARSFPVTIATCGVSCLAVETRHAGLRSKLGNALALASRSRGLDGAAVVLYTQPELALDHVKASLRSLQGSVSVDVSAVASHYGGGGHRNAASCVVPRSELEEWRRAGTAAESRS